MTRDEAVKAFREQVAVVALPAPALGVYRPIPCKRIEAMEYRILEDGRQTVTVKARGVQGSVTYSAGPEGFALAEQEGTWKS